MLYIGYYNDEAHDNEKRNCALSARNKMEYIFKILSRKQKVTVVSASTFSGTDNFSGRKEKVNNNLTITYFPAYCWRGGKLRKLLTLVKSRCNLFWWMLKNCGFHETVIVYHSLDCMWLVKSIRRLKRIHLIIEVEEIYSDVTCDKKRRAKELNYFKLADGYIFSTESLHKVVNIENKPYLVINGVYSTEPQIEEKPFDEKKHVVYSGTLDANKGGAKFAVESALYLNHNYHIHILGFGTEQQVENINNFIKDIQRKTKAQITYDGVLTGKDFSSFLQKCSIGLSTQNPDGIYNSTSFPSKILTYMANGLKVVSSNVSVVKESVVGDMVTYYDENTPRAIANVIMEADNIEIDTRARLKQLDREFAISLEHLIDSVENGKRRDLK